MAVSYPGARTYAPNRQLLRNLIGGAAGKGIQSITQASLTEVLRQVSKGTMNGASNELLVFAEAWKERWTRRPGLIKRHQQLANQARTNMLVSYAKSHENKDVYRKWDRSGETSPKIRRYARGAMRDALENPGNFHATYDGISMINPTIMYSGAKQWYRLNFGAGGLGSSPRHHGVSRQAFALEMFGQTVGTYSLESFAPRKAFIIPTGVFLTRSEGALSGNAMFAPMSYYESRSEGDKDSPTKSQLRKRAKGYNISIRKARAAQRGIPAREELSINLRYVHRKMTRGIRPSGFIDVALRTVIHGSGPMWSNIFREWVEEASRTATRSSGNPIVKIGISASGAKNLLRGL